MKKLQPLIKKQEKPYLPKNDESLKNSVIGAGNQYSNQVALQLKETKYIRPTLHYADSGFNFYSTIHQSVILQNKIINQPTILKKQLKSNPRNKSFNVKISNFQGVLLNSIRTDCKESVINSLEITNNLNGCGSFILKLKNLKNIEIQPNSLIDIHIDGFGKIYKGIVQFPDIKRSDEKLYEIKGDGLFSLLENLPYEQKEYKANTKINKIVEDLATYISENSIINFNDAKIQINQDTELFSDINLKQTNITSILEFIRIYLSNNINQVFTYGVDADGDLFFKPIDNQLQYTFFIGHDLHKIDIKENFNSIKNYINLERIETNDENKWRLIGTFRDVESINKYGVNQETIKLPAYFDDTTGREIGKNILIDKANPKPSISIKAPIKKILKTGNYRFIFPSSEVKEIVHAVDSLKDDEGKDLYTCSNHVILTKEFNLKTYGKNSVKITFKKNTKNQFLYTEFQNIPARKIKGIEFYFYGNVKKLLKFCVGANNFREYQYDFEVIETGQFNKIKIETNNLKNLKYWGLKIDKVNKGEIFYIDQISFIFIGNETYNLNLNTCTYKFNQDGANLNASFGNSNPNILNYIKQLNDKTKQN